MLKFIKTIRQNQLTEHRSSSAGQVGRYLFYAIGEILLVVIGILLALQINNWNESQKAIKIEQEILNSLQKEITDNIEQLELIKTKNELIANDGSNIIQKLAQGVDTFSSSELTRAFNYSSSIIESPVLDDIVATNSNVLVKNKGLVSEFRILKNKYDDIQKQEYYLDEFWNSKVVDFFVSCGLAFSNNVDKDTLISIKDIEIGGYSKKQFQALINLKRELQEYWDDRRKTALEKSEDVLVVLKNSAD